MEIVKAEIDGLLIIKPNLFFDERGFFFESFSEKKYKEILGGYEFVQDNISKSVKGTLRGLHYQAPPNAQGKLCQVLSGKVLDVAVDLRSDSPDYGKYASVELSDENHFQFWIPPGFAHGFFVLSDEAVFSYKCTAYYSKPDERCINFSDPDIAINWGLGNKIVSNKDREGLMFKDIIKEF